MSAVPAGASRPTLVIVERRGLVRDALGSVLAGAFVIRRQDPTGATTNGVLSDILTAEPDVVLLSLGATSGRDSRRLVAELTARAVPVVAIGRPGADNEIVSAPRLRAGGATVVSADSELSTLLDALTRAVRPPADQRTRDHVGERAAEARRLLSTLTPAEHDVLMALAAGATVTQVAQTHDSPETVHARVCSILAKLHVTSVLSALAVVHRAAGAPAALVAAPRPRHHDPHE